jgi:hypothetical protein
MKARIVFENAKFTVYDDSMGVSVSPIDDLTSPELSLALGKLFDELQEAGYSFIESVEELEGEVLS